MPKKAKSVSSSNPNKGKSVSMNRKLPDKPPVFHCSNEKPFVFHCIDREIVSVDIRCCFESDLIATLHSLGLVHFFFRFPSNVLSLVNDFCIARVNIFEAYPHDDHLFSVALKDFDAKFLQKLPPDVLEQLMNAARLLRIESLCKLLGVPLNETPGRKKGKSVLTKWKFLMESTFCSPEDLDILLSNHASLRYRCMDGKIVNVDPRCCLESKHVYHALKETENKEKETIMKGYREVQVGDIGRHPVSVQIPSKILSMVNYFCMTRLGVKDNYDIFDEYRVLVKDSYDIFDEDLTSDMLEFFDCCFVQSQPLSLLFQLMQAAYELRIQSLLELACNAIVPKLDGKSAENILKIFNLPDINHKVWEEVYLCEALPAGKC